MHPAMAKSVTVPKDPKQEAYNTDSQEATPPDRDTGFLLTPPASAERRQLPSSSSVENVIGVFKDLQNHNQASLQGGNKTIQLLPSEYRQLLSALECDRALHDYVSDKVRWDYNPETALVCFRMPTPLHDFFATSVAGEICKQLERIARGPEIFPQRQPDAQFQHSHAAYPGVVLEVSYSQNAKDLRKLAREYIMHSNGDIKAMIGIDIDYGETKESTVSVWRSFYMHEEGEEFDILDVQQEIKSQPFRAPDGSYMNQTQRIHLCLSDFAPDELSERFRETQLEISYETLAQLLSSAEKMHQVRESRPGIKSNRKIRKRKLSSSSVEDIKSADEAVHRFREKKDAERSIAHDKDYIPPSRRRKK